MKLKAWDLRRKAATDEEKKQIPKNPVYIIVDNVLDTYNVGAIFRLADAVSVEKVFLCGQTETPPNSRIKKASINTTEWVNWEYSESTVAVINKLRAKVPGIQIIAVEQHKDSVPYDTISYQFPIALIVGHETEGVAEDVLVAVDFIVELPMWGVNVSLNVMVSLGIMLYMVMEKAK